MPELNAATPEPARDAGEWFALLYRELRGLARGELYRHHALTLGPTTLLHEAWMCVDAQALRFASRDDIVRYTARVMRGLVIDHIRRRASVKRGGEVHFEPLQTLSELRAMHHHCGDPALIALDDALQSLAQSHPALTELVELRYFGGFELSEIAALRGVSIRTLQRDWDKARLILFQLVQPG